MVDPMRVRAKLAVLQGYIAELRSMPVEDATPSVRFARRYLVQAGIQVCIDLANHVVASQGWQTVTELRDSFGRLEEHEVIDSDLAERLMAMVGMRNRLVHLYDRVDDALVQRAVAEGLGDWEAFARAIAGQLTDEASGTDY